MNPVLHCGTRNAAHFLVPAAYVASRLVQGGSSGSPVIARCGRAVGLNAGGKNKSSTGYYLPLHRIVRALRLIQVGPCCAAAQ